MTTLRSPVLVVGVVVGVVFGVSQALAGGEAWQVALSAGIPIAYALVVTVAGRRSETASVLAGRPVDERWEHLNLEASAWALGATAVVVLAAFLVTQATGGNWVPYAFVCVVMAIAYAGSLLFLRLRQ